MAGIALFIAALDAIEPLAQEVDHPDRAQGVPVERGEMYVRHLVVPVVVMAIAGLIGLGAAAILDPAPGVLARRRDHGRAGRVRGGRGRRVRGRARRAEGRRAGSRCRSPRRATIGLILRQAFPPFLAALAVAPVIAAREAVHQHGDPIAIAALAAIPALVIAAGVVAFLRTRKSVVF